MPKRPQTSAGTNYSAVQGAAMEASKQFVDNFMNTLIKNSNGNKRNKNRSDNIEAMK